MACPFCQREVALTFHHLIPRKVHRRPRFKRRFTRDELRRGISICRLCHDGIHQRYDEMRLALEFSTVEALQRDASLARHFAWVARQRRAKPTPH